MTEEEEKIHEVEDLRPKPLPKLAPRGIRTFTVCRQSDETGVSGEGVVIEGAKLATGQAIIHWLYPPPRGGICLLYTSPSPRDVEESRMPSSA